MPKFNETCEIIINRDNLYDKICLIEVFVKKSTFDRGKKIFPVKILRLINLVFNLKNQNEEYSPFSKIFPELTRYITTYISILTIKNINGYREESTVSVNNHKP